MSIALFFTACPQKEEGPTSEDPNTELCAAIIDADETAIKDLFAALVSDLNPTPVAGDPTGHEANFDTLIDRLNEDECMEATLGCYGCMESLPLQSSIEMTISLDGNVSEKRMRIYTPHDDVLSFASMN